MTYKFIEWQGNELTTEKELKSFLKQVTYIVLDYCMINKKDVTIGSGLRGLSLHYKKDGCYDWVYRIVGGYGRTKI